LVLVVHHLPEVQEVVMAEIPSLAQSHQLVEVVAVHLITPMLLV
jgi:hypothetical protein